MSGTAKYSVSQKHCWSAPAIQLRTTRDTINQSLTTARQQVDNLVSSGFVTDSASGAFQASYHEFTTSATRTIDSLDAISNDIPLLPDAIILSSAFLAVTTQ